MVTCPAHGDRSPSLSVSEGKDGRMLINCFAGCPVDRVLAADGLTKRDLFSNRGAYRARNRAPKRDFVVVTVLGRHVEAPAKSCDGVETPELPPLHAAVLRVLHDHAFFAPTCCPSQKLIAEEIGGGCTRETVNRICRDLRELGLITWRHVFAPGSRFYHNVYLLLGRWYRPYRRTVIERTRDAQQRLAARLAEETDHSKSPAVRRKDNKEASQAFQRTAEPGFNAHSPPVEVRREEIWEQLSIQGTPKESRCAIFI